MDIRQAAGLLHRELARRPWYLALDISNLGETPALVVYVTSLKDADFPLRDKCWYGFPVKLEEFCLPLRRCSQREFDRRPVVSSA